MVAHLISETEVEEMQRKRSSAWKNSCAWRQRKVELQHKGNKYEEWEYAVMVQKSRIRILLLLLSQHKYEAVTHSR